jgi:hypothetical protein
MSEGSIPPDAKSPPNRKRLRDWGGRWRAIQERGGRGSLLRYAGHLAALGLVLLGIVTARAGWLALPLEELRRAPLSALAAGNTPTPPTILGVDMLPPFSGAGVDPSVIQRRTEEHTQVP